MMRVRAMKNKNRKKREEEEDMEVNDKRMQKGKKEENKTVSLCHLHSCIVHCHNYVIYICIRNKYCICAMTCSASLA
jgi:hypothetical protein